MESFVNVPLAEPPYVTHVKICPRCNRKLDTMMPALTRRDMADYEFCERCKKEMGYA